MAETDNNTKGQKPKTSKAAITSVILAFLSCSILGLEFLIVYLGLVVIEYFLPVLFYSLVFCGLSSFLSLVLGLVAFARIRKSRGTLKGWAIAVVGILAASIPLCIGIYCLVRELIGIITFTAY